MSFIGRTEEKEIKTTKGKVFKIFITQQEDRAWIATVLFAKDGVVYTRHAPGTDKAEAYRKASEWVLNHIDSHAVIEAL